MAEKFQVEFRSDFRELRSSRQVEVVLTVVQPTEPRLTNIDLKLNPTAANNEFQLVELRRDDQAIGDSFRFVFRPRFLRKNIKIGLLVVGEHKGEPKRIPRTHNQNLVNPFRPFEDFGERDARGIPEREDQFLAFEDFLLRNKGQPAAFIVGPAGSGKTTFLLRFRRWALRKWRVGKPFPFILISRKPELPEKCGLTEFRYQVDRALHLDISEIYSEWNQVQHHLGNDPKKAMKTIREALRSCNPFSSIRFPDFSTDSDKAQDMVARYEKSKEFYQHRPDTGHHEFQVGLGKTLQALGEKPSPLILVVVDNVVHWQARWMTYLPTSWTALRWKAPDTQVVIAVRYPFDVLFPASESRQITEALLSSCAQGQPLELDKLKFTLEPLSFGQIRQVLKEKLPEFWQDWWETDLVAHLLLLTGGNPQAVESVLYGWWEYLCEMGNAETQTASDLAGKERELIESIVKGHSRSDDGTGDGSLGNCLSELWDKYAEDLEDRMPDRQHIEACEHLKALALDWSAILRVPTLSLSGAEWRRRVGAKKWDDELSDLLIALGLVMKQGGNYRLTIPVLCVPIARSRT